MQFLLKTKVDLNHRWKWISIIDGNLNLFDKYVILGDLNCDMLKPNTALVLITMLPYSLYLDHEKEKEIYFRRPRCLKKLHLNLVSKNDIRIQKKLPPVMIDKSQSI